MKEEDRKKMVVEISRDITDINKINEALRESEERFRNTFEQAAIGIAHVSPEGRFLRINQRFCDIVGYTKEEMLKHTFQDITHPEDLDVDLEYVRQMLLGEIQTYSMEKRYFKKNNSIVWVNLTVSLVRESSGEPKYFISAVENITTQKQAEQALRKSEEGYRTLVDTIPHGIQEIDTSGVIIFGNDAYYRLMGYEKGEVIGRAIWDFVEFETASGKKELQEYLKLLVKDQPLPAPYFQRNRRKNGKMIDVQVDWNYKRDERGLVTGFISVLTDITERKRAEQALRKAHAELEHRVEERTAELMKVNKQLQQEIEERKQAEGARWKSEGRLTAFMDSATDGFILFDSELNYVKLNKAAQEITSVDGKEVIGKNVLDIIPDFKETGRYDKYKKVMKTGVPLITPDLRPHPKFGNKRLDLKVFKVGDGLGVIFTDITERKQMEEELQKAHDELEQRVEERTKELEAQKGVLEELNIAMKVLLKKREEDKKDIENNVMSNIKQLINPYFEKVEKTRLDDQQEAYLSILKSNLNEITSPFTRQVSLIHLNLTPTEIRIANLIKLGNSTKKIAKLLNASPRTIETHRKNIRRKIGLNQKGKNLRSYLLSIN